MKQASDDKVSLLIRDAWELLQDPSRWTKGALARDKSGESVEPIYKSAVKFCMLGALIKCAPDRDTFAEAVKCLRESAKGRVHELNDACKTHEDFLRVFSPIVEKILHQ